MLDYVVVAEVSVDGTHWERYSAQVRARRGPLPLEGDLERSVARDVEHALGVGGVRVRRLMVEVVAGPPAGRLAPR